MILVNWLIFNPLACVKVQNSWWKKKKVTVLTNGWCEYSCCIAQLAAVCKRFWIFTLPCLPHHCPGRDPNLMEISRKISLVRGRWLRKGTFPIVQNSSSSLYHLLFLFHFLINNLAQHEAHEMGKISHVVVKCTVHFRWQFLESAAPITTVIWSQRIITVEFC